MYNLKYDLSTVDPDDISDVLVKVEKSFGFRFGHSELKDVKTFGELCDIVTNKVSGEDSSDCTTQQAFYKVRNVFAVVLDLDKSSLTPGTALEDILPRDTRRRLIKAIETKLGHEIEILRAKHYVSMTLLTLFLASIIGLFVFWQVAPLGFALSIGGFFLAATFGNELDVLTLGALADKISREHYFESRRRPTTVNRQEVIRKVKDLFIAELDLEENQFTREATLF